MANPDLILYNGRIYPHPEGRVRAEAVAVWNGRVTDIGSDRDILRLRARSVETVDLRQRVVIPGLSDSHIHLLGYGMLLRTLNLNGKGSIQEVQRAVARVARTRYPNSWVVGRGWDQEKLRERRFLDRNDLTQFGSHAVFLKRICGHVGVANRLALSFAGIGKDTPDPDGGEIVRDPATGEPTGLLKEKALELAESSIPRSEEETRAALVDAARRLLRLGLTSLHCIIEDPQELRVLHSLKDQEKIPQSIYAILPLNLLDSAVSMGLATERGNGGFRVGGVKVYLDGSLGARTAALSEPYSDDPSSVGMLRMDAGQMDEVAEKASRSGFQLCIHAIGDRAVETAVMAVEKMEKSRVAKGLRHRIEHSSLTPLRLLARMRKCGIVASVQPRFIYSDNWAEQRLGSRRVHHLYPFRSMLRAGLFLAAGSDCPIEDPDPFEGVWSAVVRPGLASDERLTVGEALAAYTTGSAYASFSETEQGTLEPGKRADMAVLNADPFSCDPDALRKIRVVRTILGGKTVYH